MSYWRGNLHRTSLPNLATGADDPASALGSALLVRAVGACVPVAAAHDPLRFSGYAAGMVRDQVVQSRGASLWHRALVLQFTYLGILLVCSHCLQNMLVEHITQLRAARLADMLSATHGAHAGWCLPVATASGSKAMAPVRAGFAQAPLPYGPLPGGVAYSFRQRGTRSCSSCLLHSRSAFVSSLVTLQVVVCCAMGRSCGGVPPSVILSRGGLRCVDADSL